MKKIYLFLFAMLSFAMTQAQTPNWSSDIAPILYQNCVSCHNSNGIAPFPLTSFSDAEPRRFMIQNAITSGFMPPWPPDTTYSHFAQERKLSVDQIAKINAWVNAGAPEGNPADAPPAPVFSADAILPNHDLQVQIPTYTSQALGSDDYVCFPISSGLLTDKIIEAVEVIPGDREIVHHVLIYIDDSNTYVADSVYRDCPGPTTGKLVGGYVPGQGPIRFPNSTLTKMGITMTANSQVVLAMHFPHGSIGRVDSTKVNFHFYPDNTPGVREIEAEPLLQNWNFCIPANQERTVTANFPGVPGDYSLLSIFPHCHLLGKSWEVYGLSGANDTFPLIRIPKWDFDWQGFYFFDKIVKYPSNTSLNSRTVYDNTSNNLHNPNNPPQMICAGLNTTDEMCLTYFHFLPYVAGDENINLDSLLEVPVSVKEGSHGSAPGRITAAPNPSSGRITLDYYLPKSGSVQLEIFDSQGRRVRRIWEGRQAAGQYHAWWDGMTDNGLPVAKGLYFASLTLGDQKLSARIVRD